MTGATACVSEVGRFSNPLAACCAVSFSSQSGRKLPFFLPFIPAIASTLSAAGYRTTAGALANVGTNGNYWSSSSYAAGNLNAGNLNFNSTVVNPLNGNNRANGFSVRCVQHLLRAVFA